MDDTLVDRCEVSAATKDVIVRLLLLVEVAAPAAAFVVMEAGAAELSKDGWSYTRRTGDANVDGA